MVLLCLDSIQIYDVPSFSGYLGFSSALSPSSRSSLVGFDSQMVDTIVELDGIYHDSLEVECLLPPSGDELSLEVNFKASKVDRSKGFVVP